MMIERKLSIHTPSKRSSIASDTKLEEDVKSKLSVRGSSARPKLGLGNTAGSFPLSMVVILPEERPNSSLKVSILL